MDGCLFITNIIIPDSIRFNQKGEIFLTRNNLTFYMITLAFFLEKR